VKQVVILTDEQCAELEPWLLVPVDQANALDYITALQRMRPDRPAAVPTEPPEGQK